MTPGIPNGRARRQKGLQGRREARAILARAGFHVIPTADGFGGACDLVASRDGKSYHVETKDQARLQLPSWVRQSEDQAAPNQWPLLAFKLDGYWYACERLDAWAAPPPETKPQP